MERNRLGRKNQVIELKVGDLVRYKHITSGLALVCKQMNKSYQFQVYFFTYKKFRWLSSTYLVKVN